MGNARGWRRIGIVLSVIWFFGFGWFVWGRLLDDAVRPYAATLAHCGRLLDMANDGLEGVPFGATRDKRQADSFATYQKCRADAQVQWSSSHPSDKAILSVVLGVDLASLAFGWLIGWGIALVLRWIVRGFVPNSASRDN